MRERITIKALKHARIDVGACITAIETQGCGDTCEGLRQTLALLDEALVAWGASVTGLNGAHFVTPPDRSALPQSQEAPHA